MKDPKIHITVEYSQQDHNSLVIVTYAGEAFDIRDTDNELSLSVLKNAAGDIAYFYTEGEKEPNRVEIRIKDV